MSRCTCNCLAMVPERQMLFEALDALGPHDVLVLDRGYPAGWRWRC